MKAIIAVLIISSLSYATRCQALTLESCQLLEEVAHIIMTVRQDEASPEVVTRVIRWDGSASHLVEIAYAMPAGATPDEKKELIRFFKEVVFDECVKTIPESKEHRSVDSIDPGKIESVYHI